MSDKAAKFYDNRKFSTKYSYLFVCLLKYKVMLKWVFKYYFYTWKQNKTIAHLYVMEINLIYHKAKMLYLA